MPKVLVLLASYNGLSWIQEQINSILGQVDVDIHILLSDDLSTDGTRELLVELYKDVHQITLLFSNVRRGSGGACFKNLFQIANIAGFDYVAFADQDDIWNVNKLVNGVRALQSSGASGYSSAVVAFWDDDRTIVLSQNANIRLADFIFEGAGQGCSFILRADIFKDIQQFCQTNQDLIENFYYHDWLTYLLIRSWGRSWYFDPVPGLMYRQHISNDTGARYFGFDSISKRLSLIRNGWYKGQVSLAFTLFSCSGGSNELISKIKNVFLMKRSLRRSISLAAFVLFYGRRRFSDRLVIIFSIIFGWV